MLFYLDGDGLSKVSAVRKGLWGTKQQKELLRQQNLQKEREAEAVALKMHAGQQVLVAPEEVERHKRKQSKREDEYRKQRPAWRLAGPPTRQTSRRAPPSSLKRGVGRRVCKMHLRSMAGDGSTTGALLMCKLLWMLLRLTG